MSIEAIISKFGLFGIFIGCFLEGETVAMTGGVMAHRHLLVLWQVIIVAFAGAFAADTLFFVLGRKYRSHRLVIKLMQNPRFTKARSLLDRHPEGFASAFRFFPGMRIMGPIALANSRIETRTFLIRAGSSAVIWSVIYTALGHVVGRIIAMAFGHIDSVVFILVSGIILLFLMLRGWKHYRSSKS